jgi:hypothetical protein
VIEVLGVDQHRDALGRLNDVRHVGTPRTVR